MDDERIRNRIDAEAVIDDDAADDVVDESVAADVRRPANRIRDGTPFVAVADRTGFG